ncbi:MAG: nitroreductase family protein [Anaerolineales bacterium]|nr:nitroreductase family protein [Anaerolineales bacterium]
MEFAELVKQRYSVRGYQSTPVEEEKLNQVLEAARLAPTAVNRQPFQLIVVHTEGREADMQRIYHREWFLSAPLVICACAVRAEGWTRADGKDYTDVDVAIVVDHLTLAAADLGLGTCWVGSFDRDAVIDVLKLPAEAEPLVILPIGYAADPPRPKERKPLAELVRYKHW